MQFQKALVQEWLSASVTPSTRTPTESLTESTPTRWLPCPGMSSALNVSWSVQ